MTSQRELDSLLGAFLAEGPDQVADRVIDAALVQIDQTKQRRALRMPWRFQHMNSLSRLATAAVIGALLVGAAFYLSRAAPPPFSASPTPAVTSGPSEPAVVVPSPTADATATPGSLIAFVRLTDKPDNTNCQAGGAPAPPNCPTSRLWLVGSDGTGAHELFPDGFGGQSLFGWSPDGARLLYWDYSDGMKFYLTDVSASEPQLVDTGCVEPCQGDDSLALSSDGRRLVFRRTSADAEGYSRPAVVATMNLASGQVVELSSTAASGADLRLPGWSPDGTQIVFSRGGQDMNGPIPATVAAVYVVDVDGQNLRQISPADLNSESAVWSPDGSRIVFMSTAGDQQDIYTMRPDGTDLRQLTSDGASSGATWTPDGRILFVRGSGFWTMDADGTNAAELVPGSVIGAGPDDFQYSRPLWQPTGGPAIVPPPWNPTAGTSVGPPPPTPVATPMPELAPGFAWTGSMNSAGGDTATVLGDGRLLVTKGCDPAAVELYDPTTGTFSPTGSMTATRGGDTATRLLDGRVLFTGGYNCGNSDTSGFWASAELFDPRTGTFSPTGSMAAPREFHAATLLADGRVLVTGGSTGAPPPVASQLVFASYHGGSYQGGSLAATQSSANVLASAELYDPTTGTFSPTGSMSQWRDEHTSTLLQDGRVLVVGGGGEGYASLTSAELYDPVAGTFSDTGSLAHGRWLHTATLLQDGRVLITGGKAPNDKTYASAELYDPTSGKFSSAGSMGDARQNHTATLLQDGRVLIAGGYQYDGQVGGNWTVLSSTEIYDPGNGTFTSTGSMGDARDSHVAALLNDGRVLIAGGTGIGTRSLIGLTSAVLYQP